MQPLSCSRLPEGTKYKQFGVTGASRASAYIQPAAGVALRLQLRAARPYCCSTSSTFCNGPCRVSAACTKKPAHASIASRPFLISFTRSSSNRAPSLASPSGSNSQPPAADGRQRAA